ncbi:hypothetical protein BJX99DRAFT_250770 [Aspergillus californicus]
MEDNSLLHDAVISEFTAAGYNDDIIQSVLHQQQWLQLQYQNANKKENKETGETRNKEKDRDGRKEYKKMKDEEGLHNTRTWIKVHRKHLLPETLEACKLPWIWDESDIEESGVELVVPRDKSPEAPVEALFSVEAVSQDKSSLDDNLRILLGIKSLHGTNNEMKQLGQLRWMHLTNNGMEFNAFLRRALEAYGLDQQTRFGPIAKFFDRFLAFCEQSAFQGGRFRTIPASRHFQFPGHEDEVKVNFIAIPYFLLQSPQKPPRRTESRSKVHWVQPLVQSGYHLDSSMTHESQQAIRRLYRHITHIIHVPQLWLLSIGESTLFIATWSPTPLFNDQRSSITTRTIGQNAFPSTIRVTTEFGFVFYLDPLECNVWFKFLYRVQRIMSALWSASSINTKSWVYKLQDDGSLIDGSRWLSILRSQPDGEPLLIITSSREVKSSDTLPPRTEPGSDSHGWKLLKEVDRRSLQHLERRIRAIKDCYLSSDDDLYPYYDPPSFVPNAVNFQVKGKENRPEMPGKASQRPTTSKAQNPGAKGRQPIFKWSIKNHLSGFDGVSSINEPTRSREMRALLAYVHYQILLKLQTKSRVNEQIAMLQDDKYLDKDVLHLVSTFVCCVSDFLEHFIDRDYDCIVKGKVWAAVYTVIEIFRLSPDATLLALQADVLSIPFGEYTRQIEALHDGLDGSVDAYITPSMMSAFVEFVLLVTDLVAEASRHTAIIEENERSSDPDSTPEQTSHSPDSPIRTQDYAEDSNIEEKASDIAVASTSVYLERRIDEIFAKLDHVQDECCATFSSEDDESTYTPSGLGTIVALALESVLKGHSTCNSMPFLNIEELYATYTTSLQLEARNRPSKNLLLDINLLREELETILANLGHQLNLVTAFRSDGFARGPTDDIDIYDLDDSLPLHFESLYSPVFNDKSTIDIPVRQVLMEIQTGLQEKHDVFTELIKRADLLERQIVQRVDIIQEDHGKAILVFTILSTIFLPLSFVSSYLGMNTADIRDMELSQGLFWQVAAPFTVVIVAVVLVVAYNANQILGWLRRGPKFS